MTSVLLLITMFHKVYCYGRWSPSDIINCDWRWELHGVLSQCSVENDAVFLTDWTITVLELSDLEFVIEWEQFYTLLHSIAQALVRPRELAFLWWGCHGLCLRHNPAELAHSFYFVLVSVSVFMALSTVFHSINCPDNSPLSHLVILVLFLPYWSFQL